MKTALAQRAVESHTSASNQFQIKATGKAFKVLIDGLYGDKITSITRELWSNALDSHTFAQTPEKPFSVSFPTAFDPTFRVRDYGTGMTHDEVMTVYSTMFESTKEDDAEQVGKLGLGAKSPFAYTDSFNVVAFDGREARNYAAMIDAHNIPTIHFMGAMASDEPRGIEVSFAVDLSDLKTFQSAAKAVSLGFDVKPEISTADAIDVEWPEPKPSYLGQDYAFYNTNPLPSKTSGPLARMGCVLYPINTDLLPDLTPKATQLFSSNCIIEFPIGDLEIIASREALSYGRHEPTVDSLTTRMNEIAHQIAKTYLDRIAEAPTFWEANIRYNSRELDFANFNFRGSLRQQARWRGKSVDGVLEFEADLDAGLTLARVDTRDRNRTISWKSGFFNGEVNPQSGHIYIEDRTSGPVRNAARRIETHLNTLDPRPSHILWVRYEGGPSRNTAAMLAFMDQIEGSNFSILNDMGPPKAPPKERTQVSLRKLSPNGGRFYSGVSWDDVTQSDSPFIVSLAFGVPDTELVTNYSDLRGTLFELGAFPAHPERAGKPQDVWGVPRTCAKAFEDPKWIRMYDHACTELDRLIEENRKELAIRAALEPCTHHWLHDYFEHGDALPTTPVTGSLIPVIQKRRRQMGLYSHGFKKGDAPQAKKLWLITNLADILHRQDLLPADAGLAETVEEEFSRASERYEMCQEVTRYLSIYSEKRAMLCRYFTACDLAALV